MIAKQISRVSGPPWGFTDPDRVRGRGRGLEGEHGSSVALHAHFSPLVHETAGEIVGAALLLGRVVDGLDLERLGEGVPWCVCRHVYVSCGGQHERRGERRS